MLCGVTGIEGNGSKTMRSMALIMAVAGIMAGTVWAAPIYEYSCVSLGGGLFGHSFSVSNPGQPGSSWFVEMEWHGASGAEMVIQPGTLINQVKVYGTETVHEEPVAIAAHDPTPPANYDMNLDTWIKAEFCYSFMAGTPIEGPNSYEVESGTEGGVLYVTVPHAYIVSDGDVAFSGRLGAMVGGVEVWTPASGTSPVPEPATLSLLALGGLALIRRRKRHAFV